MSNQTVRQPEKRRSQQRQTNNAKKYAKQTARFELGRDGKPLVLRWGSHLSHSEKVQLQRRATWAVTILVAILIIGVVVGFWLNINVIIPGLPITNVNGHGIPQSQYRRLLAFKTQLELNKINGPHGFTGQRQTLNNQIAEQQKIIDTTTKHLVDLNKQLQALPSGTSMQRTNLNNQLTATQKQQSDAQTKRTDLSNQVNTLTQTTVPQEKSNFTQTQMTSETVTWLQDDELMRDWLARQNSTVQSKVNPSTNQIDHAINDFKVGIPTSSSYNTFLSRDNLSDDDVRVAMALKLRRDDMQIYVASQVVSPTYQVLARTMTISTLADAQKVLKQLQQGGDFTKIASQKSVDTTTSTKGGSLGWLALGQYAQTYQQAVVENWLFAPARKVGEISPVLTESGAYHIVQIQQIDHSRPLDSAILHTLQGNALASWLLSQHALPSTKITAPDQTKIVDTMNLPPDLPANSTPSTGQPGAPGGVPGGGQQVPAGAGGVPSGGQPGGAPGGVPSGP